MKSRQGPALLSTFHGMIAVICLAMGIVQRTFAGIANAAITAEIVGSWYVTL